MTSSFKIIFAGTPEFAATNLSELIHSPHEICAVLTQPDRPAGRGRKLTPSPVKQLAVANNIQVLQPTSLKNDTVVESLLRDMQADIMVVVAYGLILPKTILDLPKYGCLNVHASILPRWRGAAPIQRAILAGDSETGVTIMQMDEGLDTGRMLLKKMTPIENSDTTQSLHNRLADIGAAALIECLDQLGVYLDQAQQQDEQSATYASKINKADGLIDWQHDATEIHNKIRGFNPWPIAYTEYDNKKLRIWEAEVLTGVADQTPGKVIAESKQGIDVACGKGVLRIMKLQLPGGKPLIAREFINAHCLTNTILG